MNYRAVFRYLGQVLSVEALFMIPAVLVCILYGEYGVARVFLLSGGVTLLTGLLLSRLQIRGNIYAREGFVTVAISWIALSFFGALPFWLSGAIPHFVDAWFETVSGFTTTGSSILTDVERLPYGLLYWRSFSHWVGGMGVLVFLLAVIPMARGNGDALFLMRAESPGPSVGKMTPTIRQTSRALYQIYIVLTIVEMVLLFLGGMPLFDSIVNSMATAGTGGFAIKNASIAAYSSPYLQGVIAVFMTIFGVNFNMYYLILLKNFRGVWKNEELRTYLGLMLGATVLIGVNILPLYRHAGAGRAFLDSFFQVSSIMTTTGFATTDFNLWPQTSRLILVILMFFGASAGSTSGGIKISRLLILGKYMKREMLSMLRPRSVHIAQMDGKTIEEDTIQGTTAFLVAYCAISLLSMLVISLDNFSMETTVTAVISSVSNVGPGLDMIGPAGNFSQFSVLSKLILSLDMLFGRLEIFPMLLLFSPSVWKKRV